MNPTPPAKRPRRTLSPSSSQSHSSRTDTVARAEHTISPSKPILPAPIPSAHGTSFPLPPLSSGRPQSWAPGWTSSGSTASAPSYSTDREREGGGGYASQPSTAGPSRVRSRRSFEAGSPSDPGTPKMEGIDERQEMTTPQVILTRDTTSRAPRSIMACVRCRKQKMKCDGPGRIPCNGCRAAGLPCIFEPRARPKSISTLPSTNHPPFFSARPVTPTSGGGVQGFYPPGAQPTPGTISRGGPPGSAEYVRGREATFRDLRDPREPMPPPPATSINVLTSPFPPPPRAASPGSATTVYHPGPPPGLAPPYPISTAPIPPGTPSAEGRLRSLESTVRNLSSLPATVTAIQSSLGQIHRSLDSLAASVAPSSLSSRGDLQIAEPVWENYRSRAWPLTPWLIGLRERHGLQGLVVDYLGKRVESDRSEAARSSSEEAERAVRSELGKLLGQDIVWTRNEVRALGFFGTWTNDTSLTAMAIAQGRLLGLDRIWDRRKSHDDWREWIYLAIMDHLSQLVDYEPSFSQDVLAATWRERLGSSPTGMGEAAARDRDRDLKLLAWLEYGETLAEVNRAQTDLMRSPENHDEAVSSERRVVEGFNAIWRKYAPRWEAWAGAWSVRSDPILSLHFNYAILYTTSPGCLCHESIWTELARDPEGYALLERSRDAAFAVIQAICSPEIGRTLNYSFALLRPILALALHLVLTLTTLPTNNPPLISLQHIQSVIRSTYDTLSNARPSDMLPGSGLLGELAERGSVPSSIALGRWEMGRPTWRRIVG